MKQTILVLAIGAIVATAAVADGAAGYIAGSADPGAQIVVINEVSGAVSGFMATDQGTYRAGPLVPGRYSITQSGEHHATRHLSVEANRDAAVDLAPSRSSN